VLVFNEHVSDAYSHERDDPEAAERAFRAAIAEGTQMVAATQGEPHNRARLIHAIDDYAGLLSRNGWASAALQESLAAGEMVAELVRDHPNFIQNAYLQGKILYNRARQRSLRGR
jgi:hypothetical protein